MITYIYKKCFDVLRKKPIRLWGLSLMASLLTALAGILGVLPIISVPIALTITAGMTLVYLDGYKGKEVNSDQIFAGFKKFGHVAGGMAWMALWILIWGLIPVAGIVFAVIKVYEYRFTPYILMNQPEISATEALRVSMKKTKGFKGKMFLADIIIVLIVWAVMAVIGLLGAIPFVGGLFVFINVIISLLCAAFLPLFQGLIQAAFYYEIENMPANPAWAQPQAPVYPQQPYQQAPYQQYQQPVDPSAQAPYAQPTYQAPETPADVSAPAAKFCGKCGAPIEDGQKFCGKCGEAIK